MKFVYAYDCTPESDGALLITFPDVQEAHSQVEERRKRQPRHWIV